MPPAGEVLTMPLWSPEGRTGDLRPPKSSLCPPSQGGASPCARLLHEGGAAAPAARRPCAGPPPCPGPRCQPRELPALEACRSWSTDRGALVPWTPPDVERRRVRQACA